MSRTRWIPAVLELGSSVILRPDRKPIICDMYPSLLGVRSLAISFAGALLLPGDKDKQVSYGTTLPMASQWEVHIDRDRPDMLIISDDFEKTTES
jgi:hypothetical protein